jgi:hypothetical protein
LITSKDHASVQISIVDVGPDGRALNTSTTFALCGQVRSQGESDDCINRLATKAGREFSLFFLFSIICLSPINWFSSTQRLVVLKIILHYKNLDVHLFPHAIYFTFLS